MKKPLCIAPFAAALVDTNKGIRPCCAWEGGYFGNLQDQSIQEVVNSTEWKTMQEDLANGRWPKGCLVCKEREQVSGWSTRLDYAKNSEVFREADLNHFKIIELEFNSTNLCNLTCVHCSSMFSSKWLKYEKKLHEDGFTQNHELHEVYPIDKDGIIKKFEEIDFSDIRILRFKGGEPMMNPEIIELLKFLRANDVLKNIDLTIVTNGSTIKEELLDLIKHCQSVNFAMSVDGVGAFQKYIRYGDSDNSNIERFIDFFSPLDNVHFDPLVSVMVYNVQRLDEVADWWLSIHNKYPGKTTSKIHFHLMVIDPDYLCISLLNDPLRKKLIQKYQKLDNAKYEKVIQLLEQPRSPESIHQKFVQYTRLMDLYRGITVEEVLPEIAQVMIYDAPVEAEATTFLNRIVTFAKNQIGGGK